MALLEVNNVCKSYDTFKLKNVSFMIELGYIVGFIGRNGAGKTTTIKSILNITKPDEGSVKFMGMDMREHECECKQQLGIVLGEFDYYPDKRLCAIARVVSRFYSNWDEKVYKSYIKLFSIDEKKRVKELSTGMRVKFALALALSHDARLLILDEPTSGLDPVSRNELMEIFRSIVADGERSILFSTHITSDLDKVADYIIYIKQGEVIMNGDREAVINGFRLVQGSRDALTDSIMDIMLGYRENAFGFTGLIREEDIDKAYGLQIAKADIESIMLYTEADSDKERRIQ